MCENPTLCSFLLLPDHRCEWQSHNGVRCFIDSWQLCVCVCVQVWACTPITEEGSSYNICCSRRGDSHDLSLAPHVTQHTQTRILYHKQHLSSCKWWSLVSSRDESSRRTSHKDSSGATIHLRDPNYLQDFPHWHFLCIYSFTWPELFVRLLVLTQAWPLPITWPQQ